MSLIQNHEISDLKISETTGSAGRFLHVEIEYYEPWASPDSPASTATASLDVRDARQLVEVVEDWIASQGFAA